MPYIVKTSMLPRFRPIVEQHPVYVPVSLKRSPSDSLYGDQEMPERIVVLSPHKVLPDFISSGKSLIVSQAFKDIVERLGRDKNEFLPVPVFLKNGTAATQNYYFLDVREVRQAGDFNPSNWVKRDEFADFLPDFPFDFPINLEATKGAHIWREPEQIYSQVGRWLFFSDALVAAVKKAKLKQLDYLSCGRGAEN